MCRPSRPTSATNFNLISVRFFCVDPVQRRAHGRLNAAPSSTLMEIYLPVAEMSVNWLIIIALGTGVGFLSGMFGVGGGFLMTPLLVFAGIPSTVAVATTLSHVTASSMSGALAQWRRQRIDFVMAGVMLGGGIFGTLAGIWLFALMRRQGQMD